MYFIEILRISRMPKIFDFCAYGNYGEMCIDIIKMVQFWKTKNINIID